MPATLSTIPLGLLAYRDGPGHPIYLDRQATVQPCRTGIYETNYPGDARFFRDETEFRRFTERLQACDKLQHERFIGAGWRLAVARLSVDFEGEGS